MPNGTEKAPEITPDPAAESPPATVTKLPATEDPASVDTHLQEAAKLLEYETELGKEAPEEAPEAPEPAPKPEKKAKAPEVDPEPVTEPEKAPEEAPKKSKRELFKDMAGEEKAYREKETKLKERESALLERQSKIEDLELIVRQIQADPIAYLEKTNPKAYEEWTLRNIGKEDAPAEDPKVSALEKKIEELTEKLTGKLEETDKKISRADAIRYLAETQSLLNGEEYAPVRKAGEIIEKLQGQPPSIDRIIDGIYTEYRQDYGKTLTPTEVCEIMLEDAQAYLERVDQHFGQKPADPPPKKTRKKTGKTLTNSQETSSTPATEPDLSKITDKEELFKAAAELIEYEEPAE